MMGKLTQRIEIITPDRARQLLKENINNRPVIKTHLKRLCSELLNGNFKLNGETIKISKKGIVLDGQHRLMAVVETGIAIETLIVVGIDDDFFATIDQGAPRTLAAILNIEKIENAKHCASIVPILASYKNNKEPHQGRGVFISKVDSLNYFKANKNAIVNAGAFSAASPLRKLISPAYLGLLYFLFNEIDEQQCILFFDRVTRGIGVHEFSPEYILKTRLVSIATSTVKEDQLSRCAFFIFAWNAARSGKNMRFIRWTRSGNAEQDFPRAI